MQTIDLRNQKSEYIIADAEQFKKTLDGLLDKVLAAGQHEENVAFIGIRSRGDFLAKRLADGFMRRTSREVDVGTLDIGFYRDDFPSVGLHQPRIMDSSIDFSIDGKTVFLVDDVLYTGRTIRAALLCFADLGRTKCVRLVELIDRGLREMPIQADFLGISVATTKEQWLGVNVKEVDGEDSIILFPHRDTSEEPTRPRAHKEQT